MSEPTRGALRAAEKIQEAVIAAITKSFDDQGFTFTEIKGREEGTRWCAEVVDRETGLPGLIEALNYPRFGNTANLLDKAVEQIETLSRKLNELTGENWTPLYLNHYTNAADQIRAALKKAGQE